MMSSLAKIFLFGAIAAFPGAYSLPTSEPDSLVNIEARASCPAGNLVVNGGFENGLTSWNVTQTYTGKPGGPISGSVANTGYKSSHSFEVKGSTTGQDSGNNLYLTQRFQVCKKTQYVLSWSVYQVRKGTKSSADFQPDMYVSLFPPSSPFSGLEVANFEFGNTSYNATVYQLDSAATTTNPAGVWTTYTAEFPSIEVGQWKVDFEIDIVSEVPISTDFRIDQVTAVPGK